MDAEDDPRGYYHALGLAPNATQAQISHAYREWAKAFHPDVSGSTDAADFLRIKQAYDILGDAGRRRRYDARGPARRSRRATARQAAAEVPPGSAAPGHPAPGPTAPGPAPLKAVRCSACNAISLQPRFCVFHRVVSAVAYSRMDRVRGVYCPRCAVKRSVRESAISWLCGWWSPSGLRRTPVALWRNLCLGEKPADVNARLLTTQGQYFLSVQSVHLARACFRQAARYARGKDAEALVGLGHSLGPHTSATVRNEWVAYRHVASFGHAVPMLFLAAVFGFAAAFGSHDMAAASRVVAPGAVSSAARVPDAAPDAAPGAPSLPAPPAGRLKDIRHVTIGSATMWAVVNGRYVSSGYLPRFTTVEVVGRSSNPDFVTALRPNGQPVILAASALAAGSGASAKLQWCNDQPQEPPANGEIFRTVRSGPNRAVVTNAGSDEAVAKFRDAAGSVVAAVFVEGHSQAVIEDFPDGSYRFEFATGRQWNRKCGLFEQRMNSQRLTTVDQFASWEGTEVAQGRHVTVLHAKSASYAIPPVPDGGAQPVPIDQEAFTRD